MAGRLDSFLRQNSGIVRVRVAKVLGSTPRDTDAEIFVSSDRLHGTIGGGQLELRAIDHARHMLGTCTPADRMAVALGPEIGQCCGGHVELMFETLTDAMRDGVLAQHLAEKAAQPDVHIFGAGHVGRALAGFFAQLPVRAALIDSRPEELAQSNAEVEHRLSAIPEADIRNAPAGSAFIILTHDHALDFILTSEALARGDAAYVGLIGSKTKRTRFERFHRAQPTRFGTNALVCPIGAAGSGDKRPEVIAAFVTAEVMAALAQKRSFSIAHAV